MNMSDGETITAVIGGIMALILVVGGLRSHQLSQRKTLQMAIVWVMIIAGLALLFGNFTR